MKLSKNLLDLIDALTILPGIGKKSAQRMAYKLLRSNKDKTENLAAKLMSSTTEISTCPICGIYLDREDAILQSQTDKHLCIGDNRDRNMRRAYFGVSILRSFLGAGMVIKQRGKCHVLTLASPSAEPYWEQEW